MSRAACAIALGAALVAGTTSAVVWRADKPPENAFAHTKEFGAALGRVERGGAATLIAPRWALTAAHVAHALEVGDMVRFGDRDHPIAEVFIHPRGRPDPSRPRAPPEVDLALLRFAEPVPAEWTFWPNEAKDELDRVVVIAGFGDFGPAGGTLERSDGRMRAVENRVDDAGPLRLFVTLDPPERGLLFEGIGAPGDSGGPLVSLRGDQGFHDHRLLGVSSGADGPPGQYGTVDVYTRVSSHFAWVEEVAGAFREVAIVKRVAPTWPKKLLQQGVQGAVILEATVGVDGVPTGVKVLASKPVNAFDGYAIAAFKRWRFEPRLRAGVPEARQVTQRFDFQLQR